MVLFVGMFVLRLSTLPTTTNLLVSLHYAITIYKLYSIIYSGIFLSLNKVFNQEQAWNNMEAKEGMVSVALVLTLVPLQMFSIRL